MRPIGDSEDTGLKTPLVRWQVCVCMLYSEAENGMRKGLFLIIPRVNSLWTM